MKKGTAAEEGKREKYHLQIGFVRHLTTEGRFPRPRWELHGESPRAKDERNVHNKPKELARKQGWN